MRNILLLAVLASAIHLNAEDPLRAYLRAEGKPPADYVLSRLDDHNIVILGEGHWLRRDAELVVSLVPELKRRGVALAMETLQASDQEKIDALIAAKEWDVTAANALMKSANWPYVQYRDILEAAWCAKLRVIALSPPWDFREKGIRYDPFLADRLAALAVDEEHRVLVYCGMHHAFTRYQQVDRRRNGRATEFMDRFGNILWRKYGQNVFVIALDTPMWCGADKPESRMCLPFNGAIESAAEGPVGFDILNSPIAELKFPPESFYSFGHPLLRFIDYADGYIWTEPVARLRMVDLIPLADYSPDEASDEKRIAYWKKRTEDLANPLARPAWQNLK